MVDGAARPRELVYAERMSAMLERYAPNASEPLKLAARCQHIQRWQVPRSDYPKDRIGYLRWRKDASTMHARVATQILRDVGYDEATIGRVASLLRKEHLKSDAEAQTLEDVAALVFLESYLAEFARSHAEYDTAHFEDILSKTARKMSARGRATADQAIELPPALTALVRAAMASVQT